MKTTRTLAAVCGATFAAFTASALVAAEDFEPSPSLKAADLLPASLAKGPKHEVAPAVKGDGFLTAFTVNSSFGAWEAIDREMLRVRVEEVYALDKLSEISKTEIFANAFGKAAAQKVAAVAKVVADPVGTAKAVPGGVARFAKGLSRSAMSTADKMMADKPDQGPDTRRPEQKAQDAAAAAGGAAESFLISGKRREWAGKVGADPYTTNQALASKLDDVGWAAYAGGFALSVAAPSIPGLGMVETADQLVYQLPPAELLKRNDEKLKAAGVSDAARKALLVNGNFTPTLQTELASAVAGLGEATGKSEVVTLAAQSRTEGDARYIRRCVQLLARGAREVGGWKALTTSQNEIEAVAADGRLVLPWAVDYMTWNADAVPVGSPAIVAAKTREVWITGQATARAKQELQAKGFGVVEKGPVE